MPLDVALELSKAELLLGEDTLFCLTIQITGQGAVDAPEPMVGHAPIFRVVHTATGAQTLMKGEVRGRGRPPVPLELPPDGPGKKYLQLKDYVTFAAPGAYALSVIYPYNDGRDKAESNVVQVKVHPLACRHLSLDYAHGDFITGVFVNPANEKPDVVVANFRIEAGGGVGGISPVAKATLLAAPAKSIPPAGHASDGEWIAWLDQETVTALHLDPQVYEHPSGTLKLPDTDHELVRPLFIQASKPGAQGCIGGALVWAKKGNAAVLHRVGFELARKVKLRLLSSTPVAGSRPVWSMSYALSEGPPRLLTLRAAEDVLALSTMPWPEGGPAAGTTLREWRGELVAAGATVRIDDELRGAMLLWVGSGDDRKLDLAAWSLSKDGKVEETFRETVPWASSDPVTSASVKARITGPPAALLKKDDTEWFVFDAFGKMMDVPKPYNESKLPLDFVFWGLRDVVLIAAELKGGFSVKRMNGENLPPEAT